MELVPVPPVVLTLIGPVVALEGTVAVIWVGEFTTNVANTPLKETLLTPANPVPRITTDVPTGPFVGVNDVMAGATAKSFELVPVPAALVTLIRPVTAPVGTIAVILVDELTVNWACAPPKVTPVTPVKLVPVMVTEVPGAPEVGVNDATVGATVTTKSVELVPVPLLVVTVIRPVVAPDGTAVVI